MVMGVGEDWHFFDVPVVLDKRTTTRPGGEMTQSLICFRPSRAHNLQALLVCSQSVRSEHLGCRK